MRDLRGRVAVITGGGNGIGAASALAFAREGMKVVVADVEGTSAEKVAAEIRADGTAALAVETDVTRREDLEALAARTVEELGGCHLLFANAGVLVMGALQERTWEDWEWGLSVNLHGVVNTIQAFLPLLIGGGGETHIVITASIQGLVAAPASGVYATSKYALVGLGETLALDLEKHGCGVSLLCPAGVRTSLIHSDRNRPAELGESRSITAEDARAVIAAQGDTPGTTLEPDQIAARVVQAVRGNELYVLTHPHTRQRVEERFQRILAAYDRAGLA